MLRPFLYTLLVVACLFLLVGAGPTATTAAEGAVARANSRAFTLPKQCKPGKTSTEALGWRWKPNARVNVYYLKSHFNAAEVDALSRAAINWNDALQEIDAGISLTVRGERENIAENTANITVMRGTPRGKDRVGQVKYYSMSNGVEYMVVIISPEVTDLNALTSLMIHEIGHSVGLADCYGCQRGTTAMAAFKDYNQGTNVYAPSECDKYVVAEGYANQLGAHARVASNN